MKFKNIYYILYGTKRGSWFEKNIIVQNFPKVFSNDILGLLLNREIEISIDLMFEIEPIY